MLDRDRVSKPDHAHRAPLCMYSTRGYYTLQKIIRGVETFRSSAFADYVLMCFYIQHLTDSFFSSTALST